MQIPLRASGSSEIFPGTPRRPDQTQSHYWPYGQQRGKTTDGGCATERRISGGGVGGEKEKGKVERTTEAAYLQPGHTHTHRHTTQPRGESKLQSALQDRGGSQAGVHLKDERRGGK